jgi:hypothetical protein
MTKDLFKAETGIEVDVSTQLQYGYYIALKHESSEQGVRLEFTNAEDVRQVFAALKGKNVRLTTGDLSKQRLERNVDQFVYVWGLK